MKPYLNIFGLELPAYYCLTMLGIAVSASVAAVRARRAGLPMSEVVNISVFGLVGVLLGGKILYLITILPMLVKNFNIIVGDSQLVLAVLLEGSVFYGGLLGGMATAYFYLKKYRMDTLPYADLLAPCIPLFHAFGRVGCYLSGCCYGIPLEGGVVFHNALGGAPAGVPLFPVQLAEAVACLMIAAILMGAQKRLKPGRMLPLYLLLYAPMRFALEFYRGDAVRGKLWIFSTSQWISILLVMAAAAYLLSKKKRPQNPSAQAAI